MKTNETDGTSYRDYNSKKIPYSKCVLGKNFFYPDQNEIKDYHIEDFYCPDTDEIIIQGNWHAPVYASIDLSFHRCTNNTK